MTEDEAKQKWCPFMSARDANANRWEMSGKVLIPPTETCIGSACMAWRGGTRGAVKNRKDGSVRMLSPGDTYDPGAEIHFEAYDKTSGYCGLAGKP